MLTETKLFLILLLTGALATKENIQENSDTVNHGCVEPKDEGKYYLKLVTEKPEEYKYVLGTTELTKGRAELEALTPDQAEDFALQEFTFKDRSLFAEIPEDGKTVKYVVGLRKHSSTSVVKPWDNKPYVALAATDNLRSTQVDFMGNTIVFGADQTPAKKGENKLTLTKKEDNRYTSPVPIKGAPANSNLCFVLKETASNDNANMVAKYIRETNVNLTGFKKILPAFMVGKKNAFEGEPSALQKVIVDRMEKGFVPLPFDHKNNALALKIVGALVDAFNTLEKHSADVQKILADNPCAKSEAEIQELYLMTISEKSLNEAGNIKSKDFPKEEITKIIKGHPKTKSSGDGQKPTPSKPNQNNTTKDGPKEVEGGNDGDDGNQQPEGGKDPHNSSSSIAAATVLAAVLFFTL